MCRRNHLQHSLVFGKWRIIVRNIMWGNTSILCTHFQVFLVYDCLLAVLTFLSLLFYKLMFSEFKFFPLQNFAFDKDLKKFIWRKGLNSGDIKCNMVYFILIFCLVWCQLTYYIIQDKVFTYVGCKYHILEIRTILIQ